MVDLVTLIVVSCLYFYMWMHFKDNGNFEIPQVTALRAPGLSYKQFSAYIYATLVLKHSDWLCQHFQPIRILKTSVV